MTYYLMISWDDGMTWDVEQSSSNRDDMVDAARQYLQDNDGCSIRIEDDS